ncbi:peptide-methionine (S)-S-oxide reductase MsrA [Gayadomonas joobiniege]|uniref:peptide-methionine (S)-S-oxide reductase MsrA n=1 Tax=Gayadomonas joobiniege TaxID=1234606 RepID=UPI00036E4978|nr:peptide-methionine (S)-S-oxide reductase MsrA [Gayadomonas joobiniege]
MQKAIFAGGCFWCIEEAFKRLNGVSQVHSGYIGGDADTANYKAVCSGQTEHAEAVSVEFDETVIGYEQLLDVFFDIHDPTQINRQGHDVGRQYRSAIFYLDEIQAQQAKDKIAALKQNGIDVVTELAPASEFYIAEAYHQDYYRGNSQQPYCQVVISPKLAKLSKNHADKLAHLENS